MGALKRGLPRYGDLLLTVPVAIICILICPYLKQEEKFMMNALHDLLYLPGQWSKVPGWAMRLNPTVFLLTDRIVRSLFFQGASSKILYWGFPYSTLGHAVQVFCARSLLHEHC